MALSEITSFIAGVVSGVVVTIVGVLLNAHVDQVKRTRDKVYRPLYNEVAQIKNGEFTIRKGRIQSKWGELKEDQKNTLDHDITRRLDEYADIINDLNRFLAAFEKAIECDIQDPEGVLPKQITNFEDDSFPNHIQIVYSRNPDGSPKENGGVNSLLTRIASAIIISNDPEELERRMIEMNPNKWSRAFGSWEDECYEGLLQLRSSAEKKSIERKPKIGQLDEIICTLKKDFGKNLSFWRLLLLR